MAKIMQGERRTSSLLECCAEPQLIWCKDNTNCLCLCKDKAFKAKQGGICSGWCRLEGL